ncbi:excinuclease ABC subunit UvrA [Persicirhabdus sediminis]|uniref:UvrABC system protein A n=1 Tax=Persicirhabdus sediminis TaxID=454144 RepID=A0A8J7SI95_9BACT|nr:excinuclease ABC subunit UvrA [Persicirhabdus sediminis]
MIRIRNAEQHNLKGIDCDIPLGEITVVTGPSGSGKSSLAFHTLYAEGQRRYVETFSPYVRQFFDRMDKPRVGSVDGIPPAIAVEQKNNIRTTRSTVGTLTEVNDYLKIVFARMARAFDPETGEEIKPDTVDEIVSWAEENQPAENLMVVFAVPVPAGTQPAEFFTFLEQQAYLRVWINGQVLRCDEPPADGLELPENVYVVQDRVKVGARSRARLREALEAAFKLGKGECALVAGDELLRTFSNQWLNARTGEKLRPPSPGLFSFNHPLGACPTCRGFGRVIGIDLEKSVPDPSLSIAKGCVKPFQTARGAECQRDLIAACKSAGVDTKTPYAELSQDDKNWLMYGDEDGKAKRKTKRRGGWYGVKGFFDWLETKTYKMHVRIFLSQYKSYTTCGVCDGGRLQPEALVYSVAGKSLPELWAMPIKQLQSWLAELEISPSQLADRSLKHALDEFTSRLHYLVQTGLSYLTLDRPSRTLSGGEIERVNLTTCLGASLSNTLFVLDEPSVGLHPRDIAALIDVIQGLRDKGNTIVVVEHEEAIMKSADHLIDMGPAAGEGGGEICYAGPLKKNVKSLTMDFLSGKKQIATPESRRQPAGMMSLLGASCHHFVGVDVDFPLGVFCCITGVSGSGKSTLVHELLHQAVADKLNQPVSERQGFVRDLKGWESLKGIELIDQSALSKTPRSTPAVFMGVFAPIRQIFADSVDAVAQGVTPGFFSFNSGDGRCQRCMGNGFEKIEMQFLSDLYVTCPECAGRRYSKAAMDFRVPLGEAQIRYDIAEVLELTVAEALTIFAKPPAGCARKMVTQYRKICEGLATMADVGLGYLRLGQALNTLSGGESQRLKLAVQLAQSQKSESTLFILDEPTTGLHFEDVQRLLEVLQKLVDAGHSLLVIEHQMDVIKSADYIIDIGPGAGADGGRVVATGTPEEVAAGETETGKWLAEMLADKREQFKAKRARKNAAAGKMGAIEIHGAREHNLKNIDVTIPHDELVVVTGLSGSGKSTLAFDLVFAEGQRRFLDSMSPYARQFATQMEKPDVDRITGLPPTVAIEQRISQGGRKSTVATVTEIYHFLRLMYSKLGVQHCPESGQPVVSQTASAIRDTLRQLMKQGELVLTAPLLRGRKGFHTEYAERCAKLGYEEMLVDGELIRTEDFQPLARYKAHDIDVVVARTSQMSVTELGEAVDRALELGKGSCRSAVIDAGQLAPIQLGRDAMSSHSTAMLSEATGRSFEPLDPAHFSYNSPRGWCPSCRGYGEIPASQKNNKLDVAKFDSVLDAEVDEEKRMDKADSDELVTCPACEGARLREDARWVMVHGVSLPELSKLTVVDAGELVSQWKFGQREKLIARDILPEITQRLHFLDQVGLGYLQLGRSAVTLSGGEAQRIRLAAQLGSNLRGVLYVLDEPTIGLHPRDNVKLLDTLESLRAKGNSLLVVEHDEETIARASHVIELGPGAGINGGQLVKTHDVPGLVEEAAGKFTKRSIPTVKTKDAWLKVFGAHYNNLQDIDLRIPLGRLTVISGVSGCGKSSFMRGVLRPASLLNAKGAQKYTGEKYWSKLEGFEHIKTSFEVDQSPIGKTSRSCPATYVKILDDIRALYAQLPDARVRGFAAGRFSFNNGDGQCPECKGNGRVKLEMDFLPTTWIPCEVCDQMRYNSATLEVRYQGRSIGEVLQMSIAEAAEFFQKHNKLHRVLQLLCDTGLGYLKLGQPSPTLSGGEAQRIKLVSQLAKGRVKLTKQALVGKGNLYLIEEPSIGLHVQDVLRLIDVLQRLVDEGHTVVVIEHNVSIMQAADYMIDMGPEAGALGGKVVAQGTPQKVSKSKQSRTAPFLRGE